MVVPILHNEGLAETVIGRIISTIANLSEIVSIGFLTILMIILEVNREYVVIFLLLVIFLVLYRLIRRFKLGKIVDKVAEGIDHLATRIIIVVVLFLVFLSDYAGGEYILGAFFAGMLVRHAQFSPKVVESLAGSSGIFVPLFFILADADRHPGILLRSNEPVACFDFLFRLYSRGGAGVFAFEMV